MVCVSDCGIVIGIAFQGFSGMVELESELNGTSLARNWN